MSRVAVVTGAAGAIGTAVCKHLSAGGDTVVGIDTTAGDEHAAAEILSCDITDEASVAAVFDTVRRRHGDPAVLVNNAGVTGAGGVEEESPDQWRRIIDVNLTGAYLCTRQVVAGMRAAGGGRIVNIASVNARFGGSALSGPAYAASKGGLVTLSRFLALHHATDNIPGERGRTRTPRHPDVECARRGSARAHPGHTSPATRPETRRTLRPWWRSCAGRTPDTSPAPPSTSTAASGWASPEAG